MGLKAEGKPEGRAKGERQTRSTRYLGWSLPGALAESFWTRPV